MARLAYIITEWTAADWHLRGQLADMRQRGHQVTLLTHGPPEQLARLRRREGVEVYDVPMSREIDLAQDMRSLVALTRRLLELRPDVVNASTPKAGLLGMLAAAAAGVPVRIYLLRGLRLETTRGPKRAILWACERAAMSTAGQVLCVSSSLQGRAEELRLLKPGAGRVLGEGSSNGLELGRFERDEALDAEIVRARARLGLGAEDRVIGFVGRLTRDKGIEELLEVFEQLAAQRPDVYLLLIGDFEEGDPVSDARRASCERHPRILHTGFVRRPEPYYYMMDVLAFPSWREGLPNVPLQAAACEVPVVGFDTTGTRDAIRHGVTGTLVTPGDTEALRRVLAHYLTDEAHRARHGARGKAWVAEAFQPERIWKELAQLYEELLA